MDIQTTKQQLSYLIRHNIQIPVMMWGPPGIGKSSIVSQISTEHQLKIVDLRLSQLAPTDLQGLPVANDANQTATWYPPDFLPRDGQGILFLDEINMAPPSLQGIAQQLVLDRQVGNYRLPSDWFVWAAGNYKEDRGSTFTMPAPLANRFLHFEVKANLGAFLNYAQQRNFHKDIIAFLRYKPDCLHHMQNSHAWPSPRSWEMANTLYQHNLSIESAIGSYTAVIFEHFLATFNQLPPLEDILNGIAHPLPEDPQLLYSLIGGLAEAIVDEEQLEHAVGFLQFREWINLLLHDVMIRQEKGLIHLRVAKMGNKTLEHLKGTKNSEDE